ncbi:condensation domain-containing protein, partial [Bacillus altitudinis]|uniref:condensation domain-containing protein n=1 Tax=Bacillus altitudinis TaxID=293387 RepID=UPI00119E5E85
YTHNLSHLNHHQHQNLLDQYKKQLTNQPFHLTNHFLFNLPLFQLNQINSHLISTNHHIIIHRSSIPLFIKKLFHYYQSYPNPKTPHPSQPKPYPHYIHSLPNQNQQPPQPYSNHPLHPPIHHQP